ncbi:MAG: hydroxyacid dehydrogenase [Armatimonadetes bacterium]|nr:hydroxyacid dehydrogenase [Armatimonadota bacterium]
MKVLVADKFEKVGLEGLKALGCEVLNEPDLNGETLQARVKESGAEILIVRSTKVPREVIEGSKLAVIIRAGAGYNTIDVEAASQLGVRVANCPGKNSIAVAELAFGLILSADRRIPDNVIQLREGKWNKKEFSKARGIYGSTLGLVGMGAIGQEMMIRARAFGMKVVAYSRWMTPEVAAHLGISMANTVEDLASRCDVISVHVALTPKTKGMLGKAFFEAMRPGSIFINTSRAEVVDQAAMEAATKEKNIFCGLDVFEGEPATGEGVYEGSLRTNPRVYTTHHIGASTEQAQEAIAAETVRIVREFKNSGDVPNVVNVTKGPAATHVLVVRHYDKDGVLNHTFEALTADGVNVQEIEKIILSGARAAIAQIAVDRKITEEGMTRIRKHPDVLDASQMENS